MNYPKTLHAVRMLTLVLGLLLSCSAITYNSITASLCISSQFVENLTDVLTSRQCAFLCNNSANCQAFTMNDGPCELFVFERCSKPVRKCNCTRTGQVFVKQQPGLAAGPPCISGRKWAANLTPEAKTDWGNWGSWEYCPAGAFVSGFQLKVQDNQGPAVDDTSLNSVKMFCSHDDCVGNQSLESAAGQFGNWKNRSQCSKFYTGIQFRSEPNQGPGDDTAGNNVRLLCDGNWHDGGGHEWGNWTAAQNCPANSAICALRTKFEPPEGTGDSTALNALEVQCCYLDTYSPV